MHLKDNDKVLEHIYLIPPDDSDLVLANQLTCRYSEHFAHYSYKPVTFILAKGMPPYMNSYNTIGLHV